MASAYAKINNHYNILLERLGHSVRPYATFLKGFLRDPAMVGSIVPTSAVTVEAMLAPVNWADVRVFVEYGPGTGVFTRTILERMRPDAMLIAIDTNEEFVRYLHAEVADHRLRMVHGSAIDVRSIIAAHGHSHADFVLSGLPFSTLPDGVGSAIAQETSMVLRAGGAFLVYQYSARIVRTLHGIFGQIDRGMTIRNIPPCRLFWAWKAHEESLPLAA